jgi:hypothetical protein
MTESNASRRGRGQNWHFSGTECRIFRLVAVNYGPDWNYGQGTAPQNCAKAVADTLRIATREGQPQYVTVSTAVALRLMTDPTLDLVGILLDGEPIETSRIIEVRLPKHLGDVWLRILPDWQEPQSPIVVTDAKHTVLAQF